MIAELDKRLQWKCFMLPKNLFCKVKTVRLFAVTVHVFRFIPSKNSEPSEKTNPDFLRYVQELKAQAVEIIFQVKKFASYLRCVYDVLCTRNGNGVLSKLSWHYMKPIQAIPDEIGWQFTSSTTPASIFLCLNTVGNVQVMQYFCWAAEKNSGDYID